MLIGRRTPIQAQVRPFRLIVQRVRKNIGTFNGKVRAKAALRARPNVALEAVQAVWPHVHNLSKARVVRQHIGDMRGNAAVVLRHKIILRIGSPADVSVFVPRSAAFHSVLREVAVLEQVFPRQYTLRVSRPQKNRHQNDQQPKGDPYPFSLFSRNSIPKLHETISVDLVSKRVPDQAEARVTLFEDIKTAVFHAVLPHICLSG